MNWIFAIVTVLGACLNARSKWQGFILWLISNTYWSIYNFLMGDYAQACLFAVFWLLSLYGIYKWRLHSRTEVISCQAKIMIVNLCRRILSAQRKLDNGGGRIKIKWLLNSAREILNLLGCNNNNY